MPELISTCHSKKCTKGPKDQLILTETFIVHNVMELEPKMVNLKDVQNAKAKVK